MRDVAKHAGVSLASVSRVFNQEPTVAGEIAVKVLRAAEEIDYRPNRAASDLRRRDGRPSSIGLLIQDVSNQFSASLFRAVENVAHQANVSVLCSNVDEDSERERELVDSLLSRRISGLILVPAGQSQRYLQSEQQSGMPCVFLDRPPTELDADCVISDNQEGAHLGVLHLAEHGHRRIAFIGEPGAHEPARLRYRGYERAMRSLDAEVDPALVRRGLQTEEEARNACLELFAAKRPPTALFTAHNRLTLGAIRALRELGLEERVALVGFDDFELFDLLSPAITVVAQDPGLMGTLGAELLFRRIAGDDGPARREVVPVQLIERGSGEIRAPRRRAAAKAR